MSVAENTLATGWRRVLKLQQAVQALDLSGALLHKPENVYYFSGVFPIEPSFLIVPPDGDPELIVPGSSYREAVRDAVLPVEAGELDIVRTVRRRLIEKGCLRKEGDTPAKSLWSRLVGKGLGLEYDFFNLELKELVRVRCTADVTPVIREMRMVKDQTEINFIREACRIADEAMAATLPLIRPGMTEREVSGLFDQRAKAGGADETKARVRAGKRTALAFTRWMGGKVFEGPLLIDYGSRVRGYWSDITRTFYVGHRPDPVFAEIYPLVLDGLHQGVAQLRTGRNIYEVERAVRRVFAAAGHEEHMVYTAGHGIGLEIHEHPVLSLPPAAPEDMPELPDWSGPGCTGPSWT